MSTLMDCSLLYGTDVFMCLKCVFVCVWEWERGRFIVGVPDIPECLPGFEHHTEQGLNDYSNIPFPCIYLHFEYRTWQFIVLWHILNFQFDFAKSFEMNTELSLQNTNKVEKRLASIYWSATTSTQLTSEVNNTDDLTKSYNTMFWWESVGPGIHMDVTLIHATT